MRHGSLWFALALLLVVAGPASAQQRFEPLRIEGQTILSGSVPVRGLMVVWHVDMVGTPEQELRAEMRRMRDELGFKGFMFEVGWNVLEPAEGQYVFPPQIDRGIEIAREEGLWVTLLPTPHYTPGWVFQRWGDVKMKDEQGQDRDGLWLPFSPCSPAALEAQGRFQREVVRHYARHPNLLGVHLTNELAYGTAWVDYSRWADDAWARWRAQRGLAPASLPRPGEAAQRPQDWAAFCRFRQDALNTYFNTVTAQAKAGRPRFIPLYHRHNWYAHSDAFASQHGLYLDPTESDGDAAGGNVYGVNGLMAAQARAWQKPIVWTETNLIGHDQAAPGTINEMYLVQLFDGAQLQFVYDWGPGGAYSIRDAALRPIPSFARLHEVSALAGSLPHRDLSPERLVGLLWSRDHAAQRAGEHWHLQEPLTRAAEAQRRQGLTAVTVYPSFLEPGKAPARLMDRIRILYAPHHLGLDQAVVDSPELEAWVRAGGTLVVESGPASRLPAWAGIAERPSSATSYSAVQGALPRSFAAAPRQHGVARALDARPSDAVWARWDGSGEAAVLVRPLGQGRVVALGTPAFGRLGAPEGQALIAQLQRVVHPADPLLDPGFAVSTLGPHRLVLPLDRTRPTTFRLPAAWALGGGQLRLMDRTTGRIDAPVPFGSGEQQVAIPADHLLIAVVTDTTAPPTPTAATPAIRSRGRWLSATVTITTATSGAELRYTLDGSAPGPGSPLYAGPFKVRRDVTVRARALGPGLQPSAVAQHRVELVFGRGWWKFW